MSKLLTLLLLASAVSAAEKPDFTTQYWNARWIEVPAATPHGYGVYHFRRSFDLPAKPRHFVVFVSADNRYQLFVNGHRVSWGPARGDLTHWRYETVDLAPELHPGKNVLAAVVWNDGLNRAVAQISNRTAFLLQVESTANPMVDSNGQWKCVEDRAYSPQPIPNDQITGYMALSPYEKINAHLYPWGWEQPAFDDSQWNAAHELTRASPRNATNAPDPWMLVPSAIPLEEQKTERFLKVRQAEGISAAESFLRGTAPLHIPANSSARLLLDQTFLTTAYPELQLSGGKDAVVDLHYAEALFVKPLGAGTPALKGNRNDVAGKHFLGPLDTFVADGGAHRVYRPLFWRTYRYLELTVKTAGEPLTLEDLRGSFSAYPFKRNADFSVSDAAANKQLQQILSTGWRTARLCAHETYMDCPFYEQLQYAGDARIQMMVSLYMTGDARLMKNGIALLNSSRTAEGATYSRAPSALEQYIPPFSLWWIGMVHDYWMYVDDPQFVKQMLTGVRSVLDFYARYQKSNGSLGRMPWWSFVDWVKQWPDGEPPANKDGGSATVLDLQLLLAYRWAADLENALGSKALAGDYQLAARRLAATVVRTDWDAHAGLFADQPEHRTYSQQTNTLAVLAHAVPEDKARAVVQRLLKTPDAAGAPQLAQSSIYFRAYTNATLREVGLGNEYVAQLGPWHEMLADGLTTWAEWNGPDTRSDCHAWGASPNFELLRTVAGIESMAPGFKRVRIAPNPGPYPQISARMPHPDGQIQVRLEQKGGALSADVNLPAHVDGEFDWHGKTYPLHPGANQLSAP